MNITSFKKACKRYADAHNLPLSTAQEAFSRFFGFPNFDAALKSIGKSASADEHLDQMLDRPPGDCYWLDFSKVEFNLLLHILKEKFEKENQSQDALSLFSKSFSLLKALLSSMNYLGLKPLSASALRRYVSFEFLERAAYSDDIVLSDDPSGLGWYAKNLLPGFSLSRPKSVIGNARARDHFGYLLGAIDASALNCLAVLENTEGKAFLHSMLENIVEQRRLPSKQDVELLSEQINLLSIYSYA